MPDSAARLTFGGGDPTSSESGHPPAGGRGSALPRRPVGRSLTRGFVNRCPNCGKGAVIHGYLKVNDACPSCGEDLSHQRADDAPPYLTMVIVGHIVVPLMLLVWTLTSLPSWVHIAFWIPFTLIMTLTLLRPIKGAVVGLQWANRMHGFGEEVVHVRTG
ncbi:MAG: DUF983 domain-containing protein [Bauldia sp.]|nr:DUF983 domain-containing protein [Bauldia sp.]